MRNFFFLSLVFLISLPVAYAQNAPEKKSPVGNWKYEASYAPDGYNSGTIGVGYADKKYTVSVSFTGSTYKLQGEEVKYENDLLTCTVYVEGEYVKISVKSDKNNSMAGTATYSGGQIPLTLTRIPAEK